MVLLASGSGYTIQAADVTPHSLALWQDCRVQRERASAHLLRLGADGLALRHHESLEPAALPLFVGVRARHVQAPRGCPVLILLTFGGLRGQTPPSMWQVHALASLGVSVWAFTGAEKFRPASLANKGSCLQSNAAMLRGHTVTASATGSQHTTSHGSGFAQSHHCRRCS
jgi:hypothetical protein